MSESKSSVTSRRQFLKRTGQIAAASTVVGAVVPHVHAAENNTIQVALVGCGGRGTGAAANALAVKNGPIKLVAMADVFERKLTNSYENLKKQFKNQVDVPEDHKFLGFDGYKKALDCLRAGDVAIFATPPAFRWVHFTYAIQKGLHVFMEKPVTVDGPSTRRILTLADESVKKNLKVGVGLMIRHCRGRQELLERIKGGEIGDLITLRAYRMGGGGGMTGPKPDEQSELLYQIQRFHSFLWASGGVYSDYYIHQIDECSWMRGPGRSAPKPSAAATTAAIMWTRTWTPIRSNTPTRMVLSCSTTAGRCLGATTSSPATRSARKAAASSPRRRTHPAKYAPTRGTT